MLDFGFHEHRLRGFDRRILESAEVRAQRVELLLAHQVFVFVGHHAFFVFLFEPLGVEIGRVENFLLEVLDGQQIADVVQHRAPLLDASLAADLVAVVTLV